MATDYELKMATDRELLLLANIMYYRDIASGRFRGETLEVIVDRISEDIKNGDLTRDDLLEQLSGGFTTVTQLTCPYGGIDFCHKRQNKA